MNERIQELIEQAGPLQEVLSMIHEQTNNIGPRYIRNLALLDFQLERFAELIIQDCVTQVALLGISNYENEDIMWAVETSIENIKERFGITQ